MTETDARARLTAVEAELAELQSAYDMAMSAFRFDDADRLQQRIAVLDRERRRLLAARPPPAVAPEPTGIVPQLIRPRRRR